MHDGHFHTQFCPHGKGEPTEAMLAQALELGFTSVSLTEHAPLPEGLIEDAALLAELAPRLDQMDAYFEHCQDLKQQFAPDLEVKIGLEVDFIPGFESHSLDAFERWGGLLDDSLLSMHFIPGSGQLAMVDYSPEDLQKNLIGPYGTLEAVHKAYWQWLLASVHLDFGHFGPRRIGHPGLIYKFRKVLGGPEEPPEDIADALIEAIKTKGYQIDHNHSGLKRSTCGRPYLPPSLLKKALEAGIEVVYGSDAHGIEAVGVGGNTFYTEGSR